MPIFEYVCENYHGTDHLHRGDGARPDVIPCETCGGDAVWMPSAPAVRMARYDFFDRGAGRTFKDESEMKAWCKARGVSEDSGGGRFYFEQRERERADAIAKDEAEFASYEDRLQNAPEFAYVRELRDRGYFADRARRALERSGLNANKVVTEVAAVTK